MQLIKTDNNQEFLRLLNQATNFTGSMPIPPTLKFDAQSGQWMAETDEKDAEGKTVFKAIGETIRFHLILTRKMVKSTFDSDLGYYSKEFMDNYLELYNQDKKSVWRGFYKDLKNSQLYKDLQFVQVLYVFTGSQEQKLYRVKLGGSKLSGLFAYLNSFKNDNPARYITEAGKGQQLQKGKVKYYELCFTRGMEITDTDLIVSRVNQVNEYLNVYNQASKQGAFNDPEAEVISEQTMQNVQQLANGEEPMIEPEIEINVDNLPF